MSFERFTRWRPLFHHGTVKRCRSPSRAGGSLRIIIREEPVSDGRRVFDERGSKTGPSRFPADGLPRHRRRQSARYPAASRRVGLRAKSERNVAHPALARRRTQPFGDVRPQARGTGRISRRVWRHRHPPAGRAVLRSAAPDGSACRQGEHRPLDPPAVLQPRLRHPHVHHRQGPHGARIGPTGASRHERRLPSHAQRASGPGAQVRCPRQESASRRHGLSGSSLRALRRARGPQRAGLPRSKLAPWRVGAVGAARTTDGHARPVGSAASRARSVRPNGVVGSLSAAGRQHANQSGGRPRV